MQLAPFGCRVLGKHLAHRWGHYPHSASGQHKPIGVGCVAGRSTCQIVVWLWHSIISLAPGLPELSQLCSELAQVTYSISGTGKILVGKAPDGAQSPNLADAVVFAFSPASHMTWTYVWSRL